ncbi:MAG: DUF4142 domain-containing protein [Acetobacteraceae bacterium]|nr:DUF4142 domain-containing protein [Acetobacteraceae bacterium]
MRVNATLTAILFSMTLPAVALAQGNSAATNGSTVASNTSLPASGNQFLKQVAQDSINEVHEALEAEIKAHDPAVRAYARLMIDDHSILASQLGAIAGDTAFSMPPASQNEGGTKELQGLQGANFDKTFISHEVKQHKQSVQNWEKEAEAKGGNAEVNGFAKLGLPLQREHLAMAEAIQASMNKSGQ